MIIKEIYAYLIADSDVSAALKGGIYPVLLPANANFPCATYQVISTVPDYDLNGPSGAEQIRLQIDVWSTDSYADIESASQAIRNRLESFHGTLSSGTVVNDINVDSQTDYYDNNNLAYRRSTDYLIQYLK